MRIVGAAADFRSDLSGRFEAERGPLLGPNHRQIHEALDAEPARQTSFDRSGDDGRRDKSQRECHANGAFALALTSGKGFDGLIRISRQFVEPAMGVAKRFDEDNARLDPHRADR